VPEASLPIEQVKNPGSACTQVLFLRTAELGFFHFLEIVTGWLVRRLANFLINMKIYNKLTLKIMKTLSFTKNKIKKIELEIYE